MESTTYRLRLLSSEVITRSAGSASQEREFSPFEIDVNADSVEIKDGVAYFTEGGSLKTAMSLLSFVWLPLGKTPPNLKFAGFDMRAFSNLYPHDFSYHAKIDCPTKIESIFEDGVKVGESVTHLEVYCPSNAVILSENVFFFVNSLGEYVYHIPAHRSYFHPLGDVVQNMRVWNMPREGKVEIIKSDEPGLKGEPGIDGTSGTSGANGENGVSGVDGTSGTSGVNGEPGAPGINGKGLTWQGNWSSSHTYNTQDVVKHENCVWISLSDNVSSKPNEDPHSWDLVIAGPKQ